MSGPLPGFLAPVTVPASWFYGAAVGMRNRRLDAGTGVDRLPLPVVSIGNVTTGGVGKTPMVMWTLRQLAAAGRRPAVAMRGYRAPADGMGDEEAEYARRMPDVPVIADPNRAAAIRRFLDDGGNADCIVMDDGFQHRMVHRDLDVVLIDARAGTLRDRLLPAGWLREPVDSLARADAVVITHAESVDDTLAEAVQRRHGRAPLAWCAHRWSHLETPRAEGGRDEGRDGQPGQERPVDWLAGRRVLTMLGVGRPAGIHDQLRALGANVAVDIPVRDHEHYTAARVTVARNLCDGVEAMVVTAKDWVKLRHLIDLAAWPVPVVVPVLELEFLAGGDDLKELIVQAVSAGS